MRFKTYIDGWTTSHRLNESVTLPCIFGCQHEKDTLVHYLTCAPLWHIVREAMKIDIPIFIEEKLGFVSPSPEQLESLALAFQLYHFAKSRLKELGGFACVSCHRVQQMTSEASRAYVKHIKNNRSR